MPTQAASTPAGVCPVDHQALRGPTGCPVSAQAQAFNVLRMLYPTAGRIGNRARVTPGQEAIPGQLGADLRASFARHMRQLERALAKDPENATRGARMRECRKLVE